MRLAISEIIELPGFSLRAVVLAAALLIVAGCGNYGNAVADDAPFYAALPKATDLIVNVPKADAQPLCGSLGESKIAVDTRSLGIKLTTGVYGILGVIDAIRNVTPTARTAASRMWGPFPDGQHAGLWFQVTMVRVSSLPSYTFSVQQRRGLAGAFVTTLSADLVGAVAKKGSGQLHYDYAAAAGLGLGKPDDPTVGHLDVTYDLVSDPRTISLRTVGTPTLSSVDISSYADGQAALALDFLDGTGAEIASTSKFTGSGAGVAQYSVKKGIFGDTIRECWDALYCRTYLNDPANWISPPCTGPSCVLGNAALCPSVH